MKLRICAWDVGIRLNLISNSLPVANCVSGRRSAINPAPGELEAAAGLIRFCTAPGTPGRRLVTNSWKSPQKEESWEKVLIRFSDGTGGVIILKLVPQLGRGLERKAPWAFDTCWLFTEPEEILKQLTFRVGKSIKETKLVKYVFYTIKINQVG